MDEVTLERIDRYLLEQMSDQERIEFEEQMEEDIELLQYVKEQKELISGLADYEEKQNFMSMLTEIKEEERTADQNSTNVISINRKKNKVYSRQFLSIAASVAVLIIAGIFIFRSAQSPQRLVQDNFQPYPTDELSGQLTALGAIADSNEDLYEILQTGISEYDQQDYESALNSFRSFSSQNSDQNYLSVLSRFYQAQCAMKLKDYQSAINDLTELSDTKGLPIDNDIEYTLALAYLGNKNQDEAIPLLQNLANRGFRTSSINRLLNKIQ